MYQKMSMLNQWKYGQQTCIMPASNICWARLYRHKQLQPEIVQNNSTHNKQVIDTMWKKGQDGKHINKLHMQFTNTHTHTHHIQAHTNLYTLHYVQLT